MQLLILFIQLELPCLDYSDYSLAVVDSLNRNFKQITTAGTDMVAGSKYPPKWDAAHVRYVHVCCIQP